MLLLVFLQAQNISRVQVPAVLVERLYNNSGPIIIDNDMNFESFKLCTVPQFDNQIYGNNKILTNVNLVCQGMFDKFSGAIYDLRIELATNPMAANYSIIASTVNKAEFRNVQIDLSFISDSTGYAEYFLFYSVNETNVSAMFVNIKFTSTNPAVGREVYFVDNAVKSNFDSLELMFTPSVANGNSNISFAVFKVADQCKLFRSYLNVSSMSTISMIRQIGKLEIGDVQFAISNCTTATPTGNSLTEVGTPFIFNNYLIIVDNVITIENNTGVPMQLDKVIMCAKNLQGCNSTLPTFLQQSKTITWTLRQDNAGYTFSQSNADDKYSTPNIKLPQPECQYYQFGNACFQNACENDCNGNGICVVGSNRFECQCQSGLSVDASCKAGSGKLTTVNIVLIVLLVVFVIAFIAILVVFIIGKTKGKLGSKPKSSTPIQELKPKKAKKEEGILDDTQAPPLQTTSLDENENKQKETKKKKRDTPEGEPDLYV